MNGLLHSKDLCSNIIETKQRHVMATQLPLSFVNQISENIWRISMENNSASTDSSKNYKDVYNVTKNDICCNNDCKAYCEACNICYHSYSCICSDFLSKNIICEHIHLVIFFQITPHINEYEENMEKPFYSNQDHTTYTRNLIKSISPTQSIENINLCDDLLENDDMPNKQSIKVANLKIRLEKLLLETLQKVNNCNNYDLLESIEMQITNLACNLDIDLLENKKINNEMQSITSPEKNIEVYYVF